MIHCMVGGVGGEFNLGAEFIAIEGQVRDAMGQDTGDSGPDPRHYPYVRRVCTNWHPGADGTWACGSFDDHLWEVFCEQCRDTDGPAENQAPAIRQLRGPYHGKHRAEHAANKHFRAFNVS